MDFFVEWHIQLSLKNMKDWTQEYYCLKCAKMQQRRIYMIPIIYKIVQTLSKLGLH
jgi:hypothetical protein